MSDHHEGHPPAQAPLRFGSTLTSKHLLYMYGFVKKEHQAEYKETMEHLSEAKRRAKVIKLSEKELKAKTAEERFEIADESYGEAGYPAGNVRYRLVLETGKDNIEGHYFEILERVRQHSGFPHIHKVSDSFAASENSAFFGNSQQRLGIQQDRVQQFLANIGKFVKELFQMVRELRIIDERLEIYRGAGVTDQIRHANHSNGGHGAQNSHGHGQQAGHAADVTLKSIFTDLVEGGTKNPQSVFGLASQVNFTLLPDLFFNTYVTDKDKVDSVVEAMTYNKSLKAVLKRKLYQYLVWREKTYSELVHRRRFNLKYLRQHWTIIKMYMNWTKPYLRNIQRLSMRQDVLGESPDLIGAFETSYIETEFVATRDAVDGYHPVIIGSFLFRTRPDMSVRREYQQGPVHIGRMDMTLRAYAWTDEQLKAYKAMKQREEIELLGVLDSSLTDIMDALGEDFERYLTEAGEEIPHEEPTPLPKRRKDWAEQSAFAPVISIFAGFKEIIEAFIPLDLLATRKSHDHGHHGPHSPKKAFDTAAKLAGRVYHTYKKQNKMITW